MRDKKIEELLKNYPQLKEIQDNIWEAYCVMRDCYVNHGKLLLCGNGGSASDCEHIVGELLKEYQVKRMISAEMQKSLKKYGADQNMIDNIVDALPAMTLTSYTSFITAYCNDNNSDYLFAQQMYVLGNPGDVLWAISTSGNSANVINAGIVAKARGLKIVGMTGHDGGRLKAYADVLLNVPSDRTARIQEMHVPVYHTICGMLEENFFNKEHLNKDK